MSNPVSICGGLAFLGMTAFFPDATREFVALLFSLLP